eukprot:139102-Chlamydomonas_euryale.AAC.3
MQGKVGCGQVQVWSVDMQVELKRPEIPQIPHILSVAPIKATTAPSQAATGAVQPAWHNRGGTACLAQAAAPGDAFLCVPHILAEALRACTNNARRPTLSR